MRRGHRLPTDPINDAFRATYAKETSLSGKAEMDLDKACQNLEKKVLPKGERE